jgi:hypothetical protein
MKIMKKYVQGGTRQVTLFHHVTGIGTGDRGGAALGALTLSLAHGGKNPRFLARIGVCPPPSATRTSPAYVRPRTAARLLPGRSSLVGNGALMAPP